MPVTPTYPGVYIEEIPSGVRTITGVSTSVTAFVGRTKQGPVNEPIVINNYGDFENIFGGIWKGSKLGFAVRDFYRNGGKQAVIVRLIHVIPEPEEGAEESDEEAPPAAAKAVINVSGPPPTDTTEAEGEGEGANTEENTGEADAPVLILEAASEGTWGNYLQARIDNDIKVASGLSADHPDLLYQSSLFNLFIRNRSTGFIEEFRKVSVNKNHPRRVDKVLADQSQLVRLQGGTLADDQAVPAPHADEDRPSKVFMWGTNDTNSRATPDSGNDGISLTKDDFILDKRGKKEGLYALEKADIFNLLSIPPYTDADDVDTDLVAEAGAYCEERRAFYLVDAPTAWTDKNRAKSGVANVGTSSKNAAVYFPRLRQTNPLNDNQVEAFVPSGAVAGVMARTDTNRGVWKAPAGLDATLVGVPEFSVSLTDDENGELNPLAINCLRTKPAAGRVVWGARTLQGDDRLASEWKYVPIRRLALYIEESLYRGTQWVVFEPNDEPLWAQIRLNVGAFMHTLFRQGAFQGSSPKDAYFVKCDAETTTQNDRDRGVVNIIVGFAPLKPAEFVIIKLQQIAGKIET